MVSPEPTFSPEHDHYLDTWSGFTEHEAELSLIARFQRQVEKFSEKTAVETDTGLFTYRRLNDCANMLANLILHKAGTSEKPVALLIDQKTLLIAALLAVLKTRRPYIVLDSNYPRERLCHMLRHSKSDLLVCDTACRTMANEISGGSVPVLETEDSTESGDTEAPGLSPLADDLALLIYTSGSTGRPKGVVHTHRSILAEVKNITNIWKISANDNLVLTASCSFASAIRTIYAGLLNGATIYPCDIRQQGFDGLKQLLVSKKISVFRSLPTTFRHFMAAQKPGTIFPDVRILSLGGETVSRTDVEYFNTFFARHCVLVTSFGPTECLSTCWGFRSRNETVTKGSVPIGFDLPGKSIRLLDNTGNEVRSNEPGEIAVDSPFLAQGYWNDPETTLGAFSKFSTGVRTYLTGDLATRTQDGCVTHLGRKDEQVKIRGYRIEPSEVEDAMRKIAGVDDSVVVAPPNASGELVLAAYYTTTSKNPTRNSLLREKLTDILPDYMVPAFFVHLHEIPLNPNGKTDRNRLPPLSKLTTCNDIKTPPLNRSEKKILHIMEKILGTGSINVSDSFLNAGGDSLKAARAALLVSTEFGVTITTGKLLRADSIRAFGALVDNLATHPSAKSLDLDEPLT